MEYLPRHRWAVRKDYERNFVAAFFHMATIALTCTSLAQLSWFRMRGGHCAPQIAVYQFFNLGYFNKIRQTEAPFIHSRIVTPSIVVQYYTASGSLPCVTPQIANMMRILIIMCFMAIISSLVGFFLDIVGPKSALYKFIRRNALPSIITVLWVVAIIAVCYNVTKLLEEEVQRMKLGADVQVSYEYGCYMITAAGVVALLATASSLLQPHPSAADTQRQQLMQDWDGLETFSVGPRPRDTPLESIPPPPYSP